MLIASFQKLKELKHYSVLFASWYRVQLVHVENLDNLDHLVPRVQKETRGCLLAKLYQGKRVTEVHLVHLGRRDFRDHWVLRVIKVHLARQGNKAYQDLQGSLELQVTLAGRA
ncbi:hypothetical protein AMECASPLE_014724 [Ameca splendens]|uniref:Uncharacterized protein n=1 Tax=Ameca splendens TaxID=208324 RepID=A0ABV0YZP3_9TELE